MTLENQDIKSSLHLVKKGKSGFYKSDLGKLSLTLVSACPELRPYTGVINQYLVQMDLSIRAEGINAVKRYKAYKAQFLEVVASGDIPKRKFRHAMPLYRIAVEFRQNTFVLSSLHSVFRSYDLYYPPKSVQDKELESFRKSFMTDSIENVDTSRSVVLQDDILDFREELIDLIKTPEFKSLNDRIHFNRFFEPEEKAILLTKKGTAKFRSKPQSALGYAPAIVGSTAELVKAACIRNSDGSSYYDDLIQLGDLIGSYSFPSMKAIRQEPVPGFLEAEMRRHVVIPSPGFKSRVIAVGDYYTQYMLSPIHKWAFKVLSQIPSDYTFSHEKGFRRLSEFTRDSQYVACFDLSNATDALPVNLTEEILRLVLPNGEAIAPLWKRVMIGQPFHGYYYRIGQPMGLLSSWAAGLALTHHFIMWIAARKGGNSLFKEVLQNPQDFYGLVGDDVYIKSPALAHYYSIIMTALGVKINLSKSLFVSENRRVSEFAKRNSFNGLEISAISPGLIVKSFKDYSLARELILKFRSLCTDNSIPSFDEAALVETYKRFSSSFMKKAIGILSTIPVCYAGLGSMNLRGSIPPRVRFKFLTLKVRALLEYTFRGLYIGTNNQDSFNDLVHWLLLDVVQEGTFHRTQFYEFIKKQKLITESLVDGKSISKNILMSKLSHLAYAFIKDEISEADFQPLEDDILLTLEAYDLEQTWSAKAVSRAETKFLAYRVFKTLAKLESVTDALAVLDADLFRFAQKYDLNNSVSLDALRGQRFSSFGEIEE